jgi:hypothetical protein
MAVNQWGCNAIGRDNPARVSKTFWGRETPDELNMNFYRFVNFTSTVYFETTKP